MFFPMLKKIGLEKMTVTDFPGLDRRETARIGGFREMRNLCGEGYPTLRTRQARGLIATVTKPGGLTAKDALIWVDGTRICVNGEAAGPVLTEGEKDLISMGADLIDFSRQGVSQYQGSDGLRQLGMRKNRIGGSGHQPV